MQLLIVVILVVIYFLFLTVKKISLKKAMKSWKESIPTSNNICIVNSNVSIGKHQRKLSNTFNLYNIQPFILKKVSFSGRNTSHLTYSLRIKNISQQTHREVILQCGEYDTYGRKDLKLFTSFSITDLRPNEIKEVIFFNKHGILALEQIDIISIDNVIIETISVFKRLPAD